MLYNFTFSKSNLFQTLHRICYTLRSWGQLRHSSQKFCFVPNNFLKHFLTFNHVNLVFWMHKNMYIVFVYLFSHQCRYQRNSLFTKKHMQFQHTIMKISKWVASRMKMLISTRHWLHVTHGKLRPDIFSNVISADFTIEYFLIFFFTFCLI